MTRIVRTLIVAFLALTSTMSLSRAGWFVVPNPATGNPEAVWSHTSAGGATAEILYSYLDGGNWAPSVSLSGLGAGAAAPVLAFEPSGGRRVVWEGYSGGILMRTLAPSGGLWSQEIVLSDPGEQSTRPAAVALPGETFVVYEVLDSGGRTARVSKMDSEGNVERGVLAVTTRETPLEIELHEDGGYLWADWIDSGARLGYRVWTDGAWAAAGTEPYEGAGDVKGGRERIRQRVLNGE